jgi:hypothetical protein
VAELSMVFGDHDAPGPRMVSQKTRWIHLTSKNL